MALRPARKLPPRPREPASRLCAAALLLAAWLATGCLAGREGRPAGSPCESEADCAPGLVCQFGRCRPVCLLDRDCPSGACIPSEVDPDVRICVLSDEGGEGEPCPGGSEPDADGVCREPCDGSCPEGYGCLDGFCRDLPGEWATSGPIGMSVSCIVLDPLSPTTLYASGRGVYRSDDDGDSWQSAGRGLEGAGGVYALVIDPADPRLLYAGTPQGVYATDDGATSWTKKSAGLAAGEVRALSVDPVGRGTVYAGVKGAGVFRSDDQAATWSVKNTGVASFGIYNDALVIEPEEGLSLWLGTWLGGVFRTDDRGESWTELGDGGGTIYSLVHGRVSADTLYSGTFERGVHRTTDGGRTWEPTASGPRSVRALAVDGEGWLYVGTASQGVSKTTDGGASWTPLASDLPFLKADGHIAIHPSDRTVLYVGTTGGVVRSRDSGTSWTLLTEGMPAHDVRSLGVRPDEPSRLYALTATAGLFTSEDRGASWASKSRGLGSFDARHDALAVDPLEPDAMVIATFNGLFRSVDGGESWTGPTRRGSFFSVVVDPGPPRVFYAAEFEDGLWKSVDGGESWELTTMLDGRIKALAVDPTGIVYVGSGQTGVHRSLDGVLWERIDVGLPADADGTVDADGHIAVDPADPSVLYVAVPAGVYRSVDGGDNWSPTGLAEDLRSVVVDPADPRHLLGGGPSGVYESRDGGETWTGPELGLSVESLALSPDGATLYAATSQGVWYR